MLAQRSESGGITREILTNTLRYLDSKQVLTRENGLLPFLLVDAHGSRFSLEFLRYINNAAHKWCVCIGVPYGTSFWQVADSEEQNGAFTDKFAEAKTNLLKKLWDTGNTRDLNRHDLIPMLNSAFDAFCNVQSNLKAIDSRGWGRALNRALLDLPQIRSRMTEEDHEREKTEPWGNKYDETIDNLPSAAEAASAPPPSGCRYARIAAPHCEATVPE